LSEQLPSCLPDVLNRLESIREGGLHRSEESSTQGAEELTDHLRRD
jgi:hypothetical protein